MLVALACLGYMLCLAIHKQRHRIGGHDPIRALRSHMHQQPEEKNIVLARVPDDEEGSC